MIGSGEYCRKSCIAVLLISIGILASMFYCCSNCVTVQKMKQLPLWVWWARMERGQLIFNHDRHSFIFIGFAPLIAPAFDIIMPQLWCLSKQEEPQVQLATLIILRNAGNLALRFYFPHKFNALPKRSVSTGIASRFSEYIKITILNCLWTLSTLTLSRPVIEDASNDSLTDNPQISNNVICFCQTKPKILRKSRANSKSCIYFL